MKLPVQIPSPVVAALLATFSLAAGGCGSGPAPRDLMLEEAGRSATVERPVAMRGEGSFLGGNLASVATVTRGFDRGNRAPRGKGPGGGQVEGAFEEPGRRRRDDAGAFSEVYYIGGYGDSEEEQKEAMQDYIRQARARRAAGSPMPPVTLKVAFENRGKEPIEIEVLEVNSDLGNFAVRPPRLTIPAGGSLRIRSRADDECVYLVFADTGAGIRADDLGRLFQPYHTTKPGGNGLGLMIAQRIMREHGGQVGIESKEGVGTVVTLQFPRRDRRARMLKG